MDLESMKAAPLEATLQQVARVLNHPLFAQSRGPARLLMHLADQLATKGGCPATQADLARVLGLPEDFDPTSNPLVRMHMSKLRRKLERYRSGDGQNDAVTLEIPRNSYRLQGLIRETAAAIVAEIPGDHPAPPGLDRSLVLISEFACEDDSADGFTRGIAFWLVAELVETLWIAAVGPVLRERIAAADGAVDSLARRFHVPYVLSGCFSRSDRGVQISVRLVEAASGRTCWADWFDDPTDLGRDHVDRAARQLAGRVADRLRQCPMASATRPMTDSPSVIQPAGHEPQQLLDQGDLRRTAG